MVAPSSSTWERFGEAQVKLFANFRVLLRASRCPVRDDSFSQDFRTLGLNCKLRTQRPNITECKTASLSWAHYPISKLLTFPYDRQWQVPIYIEGVYHNTVYPCKRVDGISLETHRLIAFLLLPF